MSLDPSNITLPDGRTLASLKVVDLKEKLGELNLSKVGNKKELLQRLANVYSDQDVSINMSQIESESSINQSQSAVVTDESISREKDNNSDVKIIENSCNLEISSVVYDDKSDSSNKLAETIENGVEPKTNDLDQSLNSNDGDDCDFGESDNQNEINPEESSKIGETNNSDETFSIKEPVNNTNSVSDPICDTNGLKSDSTEENSIQNLPESKETSLTNDFPVSTAKDLKIKAKKRKWGLNKSYFLEKSICSETLSQLIPEILSNPRSIDQVLNEESGPPPKKELERVITEEKNNNIRIEKPVERKEQNGIARSSSDLRNQIHRTDKTAAVVKQNFLDGSEIESAILDADTEKVFKTQASRPAQNDVSEYIYITCLVRPYNAGQLFKMLQNNYGKVDEIWLDNVKSQAIVKFENSDIAQKCREEMDGSKWPKINPRILKVEYCTETLLVWMKTFGQKGDKLPPKQILYPAKKSKKSKNTNDDEPPFADSEEPIAEDSEDKDAPSSSPFNDSSALITSSNPTMDVSHKSKQNNKTTIGEDNVSTPTDPLDALFNFTSTNPKIFWKPLTKEQAEAQQKRRLEEFEKKMKHGRTSFSPRPRRFPRKTPPRYPARRRPSPRNYRSTRKYSRSPFKRR